MDGHSNRNLMKNSSIQVAMHQSKAFMLSELAKEETKALGVLSAEVLRKEEDI